MRTAVEGYNWIPASDGESGGTVYRLQTFDKPTLYLKYGAGKVADDITAEMVRLRWLSGLIPVPQIRRFLWCSEEAFLLTTGVSGVSAYDCLTLDVHRRRETVTALAQFLRAFHSLPVAECPFNSSHELRLAEARRNLESGQVDESDFDSDHEGWNAEQVWSEMLSLLPTSFDRVVTHGDFSVGNILLENCRVTGCIDVGRAGVADPYQDLAILWHNLQPFGGDLQMHLFRSYGIAEPDARKIQFHLCLDEFF